jgi:glycosyltransferase involved in cell wall biosynthesis
MKNRNDFRYESVFALASFQFCGHIDEYLIANTRRLCLMYVLPRFGEQRYVIRRYEEGRLIEERSLKSSQNIFLYYWLWFWHHNAELFRFTKWSRERTLVFCGHPVCFFGMSLMKLLRKLSYLYWIGDYFPNKSFVIRAFERVKRFYHDHASFTYYLSDAINRKMNNGKVRAESGHRTLMWGMRRFSEQERECANTTSRRLLFVGLVRDGQGIEDVLDFLADNRDFTLSIVGVAANGYENNVEKMIADRRLSDRVYFPNRFHSQEELLAIAGESIAGLALYSIGEENFTHYADPGKVKAYIEMNLPVVMTRISEVVPFIEKFHAGVVVDGPESVGDAVRKIVREHWLYNEGVRRFNEHFEYTRLYADAFCPVEELWSC